MSLVITFDYCYNQNALLPVVAGINQVERRALNPNQEVVISIKPRIRFSTMYTVNHRRPSGMPRKKADVMKPKPPEPEIDRLIVRSTKDGWSLMVDDLNTPAWTLPRKKKAVEAALETAKQLGTRLMIETRTGKVQDTHDFSEVN